MTTKIESGLSRSNEELDIDLAKLFGGKPERRKTSKPHTLVELQTRSVISRNRKYEVEAARLSSVEYTKRKRARNRKEKKATTNMAPIVPCIKRYMEFKAYPASHVARAVYKEAPERILIRPTSVFELSIYDPEDKDEVFRLEPFLSVTSAREALIMCATLLRFGHKVEFNMIRICKL